MTIPPDATRVFPPRLKDPAQKNNRDYVDIIIALRHGKGKGFDWIWCEHALTVGYRSSLNRNRADYRGRADPANAPGKARARGFTNLIAEPDASEEVVYLKL